MALEAQSIEKVTLGSDDEEAARLAAHHVAMSMVVPSALKAAILLGVPTILDNAGPDKWLTAEEIAELIPHTAGASADAENLGRILRVLAGHDLLKESVAEKLGKSGTVIERRYAASGALKYLLDDDQGRRLSFASIVFLNLSSLYLSTYGYLHSTVLDRTAEPLVQATGMSLFEKLSSEPDMSRTFHRAMVDHSNIYMTLFLDKYDGFKNVKTLVDVGGGFGVSIASIVSKYPHIRAINFDQPHVISTAPPIPGVEFVGGNFFEEVPACDAVFMKFILHDWNDEDCVKILKTIAKALPENGKVINFDAVLPDHLDSTTATKISLCYDAMMMAVTKHGRERTLSQFLQLGAQSGFSRVQVVTAVDNLSVIEFHKK